MSRTLWRVRPRGERPTTVAKPKENLIANCPLLNHYLGARWPSTTCRRISVLSLPQTAHSRLAVACARCFPPPCQGDPRVCRCPADPCRPRAGCDPQSPTGAVLWGCTGGDRQPPAGTTWGRLAACGWPPVHLAAGPPTYTGVVNTLKRRAADAGVKASISTGCATPLLCAGCAARHRNRTTGPRRVDVQRMPRWRAAPLRQLHRSGRHALNDRRIACRRCGVSVWRRDVGCRPGFFDL